MNTSPNTPDGFDARTHGVRPKSWWQTLKEADARRAPIPGEHLAVAGLGLVMLVAATRSRSATGRLLKAAIGGALIGRAASGTGGVTRLAETALELADKYIPKR